MGRKRLSKTLEIYMNGLFVGSLNRPSTGVMELVYSDEWMVSGRSISLSLPVITKSHRGEKVANYFDNLLPDNENIKRRIQMRFKADSTNSVDLLSEIGRDCIGAIQLLPEGSTPTDTKTIKAEPLSEVEISEILTDYQASPLGMQEDSDFRISIAGAQEKTALLMHNGKWCRPAGATPTSHIFKLPMGVINNKFDMTSSIENEWLCGEIIKGFGLPVANMQIMTFGESKALVVERFDRKLAEDGKWIIRLPQEDMCQAMGISPAIKYESDGGPGIESIMKILQGSENSMNDRRTFMKSVFIFWLLGAIDGHGKNFSIFLSAGDKYKMTPLYDVLSAYPLLAEKQLAAQKIKMAMSVSGKSKHHHWDKIQLRHWLSTAKLCGFPEKEMTNIIDETSATAERTIQSISLPKDYSTKIYDQIAEYFIKKCRQINT